MPFTARRPLFTSPTGAAAIAGMAMTVTALATSMRTRVESFMVGDSGGLLLRAAFGAEHRADLHLEVRHARIRVDLDEFLRELQRFLLRRELEDREAADDFLALRERPIDDRCAASVQANAR